MRAYQHIQMCVFVCVCREVKRIEGREALSRLIGIPSESNLVEALCCVFGT